MADLASLDVDLPLPQSDTGRLGAAVRCLHPVARRATEPFDHGPPVSWWGAASADAVGEVAAMRAIAADLGVRAEAARLGLAAYVSAVVNARGGILGLRQQWQQGEHRHRVELARLGQVERAQGAPGAILATAAAGVDVAAAERAAEAEWQRLRADLRTRHGSTLRALEAERARAVAVLRGCAQGIAGTDRASTRAAVLAKLPLAAAAERAARARLVIAALRAELGDPTRWGPAEWARVAALGDTARDPVAARELLGWLGPSGLLELCKRLRSASSPAAPATDREAASGALTALALALAAAVNPRSAGPDPDLARHGEGWRASWLTGVQEHLRRDHDGVLALATLLRRAGALGVSPGADFARRVAPEFVRFDATALPLVPALGGPLGAPADPRDEAILGLLAGLGEDAEAIRALLATRYQLSDGTTGAVVDYLVASRTTRGRIVHEDVTMALVAALRVATTGPSREAAVCASSVIGAQVALWHALQHVHPQSQTTATAANAHIATLVAQLLAAHPEALTDALFDPPPTTPDGQPPGSQDLVTATQQGYRFVLPDRAAADALLAMLARSSTLPTGIGSAAAPDTPISYVLTAVLAHETRGVAAALAARRPDARTAALNRLGTIAGYAFAASSRGQLAAHATADELARAQQQLYRAVIDRLEIPGRVKKNLPAWAADACLRLAKVKLRGLVEQAMPTDSASRAGERAVVDRIRTRDELRDIAWDLVSATSPLPDPRQWTLPPGGVPFWDADGRPLPLALLHGAARQTMIQWTHDVPEYQLVTSQLWDDFELGQALSRG